MSVSHKMDLVIRHEQDRRFVSQMLNVLDAEREKLEKMVEDNIDSKDDVMPYILFAWEKYADSMKDVSDYFKSMLEKDR